MPDPAARHPGYVLLPPLVGVLALAAFAALAAYVAAGDEPTSFDHRVAEAMHQHGRHWPGVWRLFRAVTVLGDFETMWVVGAVAATWALATRRPWLAATAVAAMMANGWLVAELKAEFARVRPTFPEPRYWLDSPSFPSGHAAGSMFGYGLLAYLVGRYGKSPRRWWLVGALAAVVLAVGFSRVYLTVHYVTDVLAGYALSLAGLAAWVTLMEWEWRHFRGRPAG